MKIGAFCFMFAIAAAAAGETISVPAGKTVKIEPGRVFTGDVLVKTGEGTLDLTDALLKNAGLEIREGAVKFAGGKPSTVTTRHLKWSVVQTRPGKSGPPEYANTGSQFAEFRIFRNGKPLPMPKNATAVLSGMPDWHEGPGKGIDGNVNTKCYHSPLVIDFGEEVTLDGYSFVTANDAIGRDPRSWRIEAGMADGSSVNWVGIGFVDNFDAPKERLTEVGKIFPVALRDVIPPQYPVTVCGKGVLCLTGVNETLEQVKGCGLIRLEGSSVDFGAGAAFSGTVAGDGSVNYKKR